MLVMTGEILLTIKTSVPSLKTRSATYRSRPLVKVTTAMTAATAITTPSIVRKDRSLLAHNDCRAIRIASLEVIAPCRRLSVRGICRAS
jgi:hypothetical protein